MRQALAIVYRTIASHLIKKAGLTHKAAKTDGITLIQRFGSALNLNAHFHMLLLDIVYTTTDMESGGFKLSVHRYQVRLLARCIP